MSRKAKLEGNIHDVATRPQPTDPRSATAQQAARRHPIAPSIAPAHGQQHGAANTSPRPNQASISSVSSVPHMAPVTTRALRTLEFLTTAAPPTTDPQRAIRRAARRRSSSSSALSLSSISWASWRFRRLPYPTPPSPARYLVFQRLIRRYQGQLSVEALQAHRFG